MDLIDKIKIDGYTIWAKYALERLKDRCNSIRKRELEKDLSMQQLGALIRIHRKGNLNVTLIGSDMGVSNAAASQLLDRMVQLGLIERSTDPNDRRIKIFSLTERGQEILRAILRASQLWMESLVNKLNDVEKKETIVVLERLMRLISTNNSESYFEH